MLDEAKAELENKMITISKIIFLIAAGYLSTVFNTTHSAPLTLDFDAVPPILLSKSGQNHVVLDASYQITGQFPLSNSLIAIDNGLTPPDLGSSVEGDLASQNCFAGICTNNGTSALYSFGNAGFILSLIDGGTFDAVSFDAALASNSLNRATRFAVTGYREGLLVSSTNFLLLPYGQVGFSLNAGETFPNDTVFADGYIFSNLSLIGYSKITSLAFQYIGELLTDPQSILDAGNAPEFAIDNISIDNIMPAAQNIPAPNDNLIFISMVAIFLYLVKRARLPIEDELTLDASNNPAIPTT